MLYTTQLITTHSGGVRGLRGLDAGGDEENPGGKCREPVTWMAPMKRQKPERNKTTVSDVGTRGDQVAGCGYRSLAGENGGPTGGVPMGWPAWAQSCGGTVGSAAAACGSCWAEEGRPGSRLWLP